MSPDVSPSPPLSTLTTMGVGGPARRLIRAESIDELHGLLSSARDSGERLYLLGGGSNIVVADEGIEGTVVMPCLGGTRFEPHGDRVRVSVGSGVSWDAFVDEATRRGLRGVECLSGIPGKVGATPIQNVGAYGQEVSDSIVRVVALDRRTLEVRMFSHAECSFGYRDSFFKQAGRDCFVIVSVEFELEAGPVRTVKYAELEKALSERAGPHDPAEVRRTVLALRRNKSMVIDELDENRRSAGSFFVNPIVDVKVADDIQARTEAVLPRYPATATTVKLPAAWLIERAGLARGTRQGPVGLSSRHSLAIVAHDGAKARDVVRFAWYVRRRVESEFGVRLVPEPEFWGFDDFDEGLPRVDV